MQQTGLRAKRGPPPEPVFGAVSVSPADERTGRNGCATKCAHRPTPIEGRRGFSFGSCAFLLPRGSGLRAVDFVPLPINIQKDITMGGLGVAGSGVSLFSCHTPLPVALDTLNVQPSFPGGRSDGTTRRHRGHTLRPVLLPAGDNKTITTQGASPALRSTALQ